MNLIDLVALGTKVAGGEKGAKIPWDDPDFSRRMLENHLSQEHDWASRRQEIITKHTTYITKHLNLGARILDMGCGPGLYTQRLAESGFHCVGVDFSPASIEYAKQQAISSSLDIDYVLRDIREYRNDTPFDCIYMTFGEFNVFTRQDGAAIVENCSRMLRKGGTFILEAHTYEAVREIGTAPAAWQRVASGLFSENPYLCLQENTWNIEDSSALSRYFIIDAASAIVQQYASFTQAYTFDEYSGMLDMAGFRTMQALREEWPSGEDFKDTLQVFCCKKK